MRHAWRHARRLRRDAAALGLRAPEEDVLVRSLRRLGRERFGDGPGVVRLALRPDPDRPAVAAASGDARPLGPESQSWRTLEWAGTHPGAGPAPGAKCLDVPCYEEARQAARRAGADDALLFDAAGLLVEGARSNVFVVCADGTLVTPPLRRGAVAGVAREIVLECVPEAREADVPRATLEQAREVVLVNAVRGAVRVFEIDGRAVGRDPSAPWTLRLQQLLRSDPAPGL